MTNRTLIGLHIQHTIFAFTLLFLMSACEVSNNVSKGGSKEILPPVSKQINPVPEPVNGAPSIAAMSVSTKVNHSVGIVLSAVDAESDELTYTVGEPAHGELSGDAPNLTYTPETGFYGTDSFKYSVSDGNSSSEQKTVSISVSRRTIFIRASGHTTEGVDALPVAVVSTAQAAVDAAIAASPTTNDPVLIDVGVGSFGDVRILQNFGENVSWQGVTKETSIVGNINANGQDGAQGVDDGNGTPVDGQVGSNAFNLKLVASGNLSFGDISSNGGGDTMPVNGGAWATGNAGNGGNIVIEGAIVRDVFSMGAGAWDNISNNGSGGNIQLINATARDIKSQQGLVVSGPSDCTGAVGSIVLNNSQARNVMADALQSYSSRCAPPVGGNITLSNHSRVASLSANGTGTSNGDANSRGGIINVSDSLVEGDVMAMWGGGGAPNTVGYASVNIVRSTVLGMVNVESDTYGARGGAIVVEDSTTGSLIAYGGASVSWFGTCGVGGDVTVTRSTTGSINANGGNGDWAGHNGCTGGIVVITGPSIVGDISVVGGNASLNDGGTPGNGGTVQQSGTVVHGTINDSAGGEL